MPTTTLGSVRLQRSGNVQTWSDPFDTAQSPITRLAEGDAAWKFTGSNWSTVSSRAKYANSGSSQFGTNASAAYFESSSSHIFARAYMDTANLTLNGSGHGLAIAIDSAGNNGYNCMVFRSAGNYFGFCQQYDSGTLTTLASSIAVGTGLLVLEVSRAGTYLRYRVISSAGAATLIYDGTASNHRTRTLHGIIAYGTGGTIDGVIDKAEFFTTGLP